MRERVKLLDSQLSQRLREMISVLVDETALDPYRKPCVICNPILIKNCIVNGENRDVSLEIDLKNRSVSLYDTGFVSHSLYSNLPEDRRKELVRVAEEIIYCYLDEEHWQSEGGTIHLNFDLSSTPTEEFLILPVSA